MSKSRYPSTFIRATVFCIATCALILAGCATLMSLEEASGELARLELRVLDARMPSPMIHWKESPWHVETALVLNPSLKGCEQVRIYASSPSLPPVELTSNAIDKQPVQLGSQSEELSLWKGIPDTRCALLVTIGRIAGDDFTGVSISRPGNIIRRHGIVLQDDVAAKHGWWGMVPVAVLFDVTHIPLYYAVA